MIRHSAAPDTATRAPQWQDQAECRRREYSTTGDLWFSDSRQGDVWYALGICNSLCPVRDACRAYALNEREEYGIWGGLTEGDRRSIWRKARRERERRNKARAAEVAA